MQKVQYLRALVVAGVLICPVASAGCGASSGGAASHAMSTTDDATISTRVKTALLNEPGVNATAINVATASGVVTLSGQVKSADEEQKAVATAKRIPGVRDVKSELKVGG
ncbi:MAG TPA: BON domain-containing protein [Vicinamibacterales bacterium]|jgi:hyperosmotically inducible protein|nr:BON domain-containing protein [Vicinamibacterales bacterium]